MTVVARLAVAARRPRGPLPRAPASHRSSTRSRPSASWRPVHRLVPGVSRASSTSFIAIGFRHTLPAVGPHPGRRHLRDAPRALGPRLPGALGLAAARLGRHRRAAPRHRRPRRRLLPRGATHDHATRPACSSTVVAVARPRGRRPPVPQKYPAEQDGKDVGEAMCDVRDADSPRSRSRRSGDLKTSRRRRRELRGVHRRDDALLDAKLSIPAPRAGGVSRADIIASARASSVALWGSRRRRVTASRRCSRSGLVPRIARSAGRRSTASTTTPSACCRCSVVPSRGPCRPRRCGP